jgi:transcriptional regulator with XRE-family HTH domain
MENEAVDDKEYYKKVGKRIRKIRLEKNIRQVELALRCDIDKQNMNQIEKVGLNLTLSTLLRITAALGIEMSELFKDL